MTEKCFTFSHYLELFTPTCQLPYLAPSNCSVSALSFSVSLSCNTLLGIESSPNLRRRHISDFLIASAIIFTFNLHLMVIFPTLSYRALLSIFYKYLIFSLCAIVMLNAQIFIVCVRIRTYGLFKNNSFVSLWISVWKFYFLLLHVVAFLLLFISVLIFLLPIKTERKYFKTDRAQAVS